MAAEGDTEVQRLRTPHDGLGETEEVLGPLGGGELGEDVRRGAGPDPADEERGGLAATPLPCRGEDLPQGVPDAPRQAPPVLDAQAQGRLNGEELAGGIAAMGVPQPAVGGREPGGRVGGTLQRLGLGGSLGMGEVAEAEPIEGLVLARDDHGQPGGRGEPPANGRRVELAHLTDDVLERHLAEQQPELAVHLDDVRGRGHHDP